MTNTINPTILRRYYEDRYGRQCSLSYDTILRLWTSTRTSTAKGRHIPRQELFDRADRVIAMMRTLQLKGHRASPKVSPTTKDHGQ